MERNTKLKLPTGLRINGTKTKNITFDFVHKEKRYRVTTKFDGTCPKNVDKANRIFITLKSDLDRGQFYAVNYEKIFVNMKELEKLDVNYNDKASEALMCDLFEEQTKRYDLAHANKVLSYASLKSYNCTIKQHLIPYFGNMPASEIKVKHIEDFVAALNLSKKRIIVVLTPFRVVMKRAKKNELIKSNPFDELEPEELKLYYKSSDYQIEPFNTTEKEAITRTSTGQVRNFIQFAFWTGMRIGEMLALKWSDVDFEKELVSVTKTKSLGIVKTPKTKAGMREVELTPLALQALKSQFEYTGHFNDVVFHNPTTSRSWAKPDSFRRHWEQILEEASIKYRNPHQMRHTFISYMLMMGNRPEILYKMVGHNNTEMIYKVYGKFIEGESQQKKLLVT